MKTPDALPTPIESIERSALSGHLFAFAKNDLENSLTEGLVWALNELPPEKIVEVALGLIGYTTKPHGFDACKIEREARFDEHNIRVDVALWFLTRSRRTMVCFIEHKIKTLPSREQADKYRSLLESKSNKLPKRRIFCFMSPLLQDGRNDEFTDLGRRISYAHVCSVLKREASHATRGASSRAIVEIASLFDGLEQELHTRLKQDVLRSRWFATYAGKKRKGSKKSKPKNDGSTRTAEWPFESIERKLMAAEIQRALDAAIGTHRFCLVHATAASLSRTKPQIHIPISFGLGGRTKAWWPSNSFGIQIEGSQYRLFVESLFAKTYADTWQRATGNRSDADAPAEVFQTEDLKFARAWMRVDDPTSSVWSGRGSADKFYGQYRTPANKQALFLYRYRSLDIMLGANDADEAIAAVCKYVIEDLERACDLSRQFPNLFSRVVRPREGECSLENPPERN